MQIRILFDNQSINSSFQSGLGFSCLLGDDVLFDTGADGLSLERNIQAFGVDVSLIKHIVISHDHWDHIGGLWWVLEKIENATVYICPGFSHEFINKLESTNANIVECVSPLPITDRIWTTGQIEGRYKDQAIFEQSIVLRGNQNISVVTGCAHPGIVEILREIKSSFPKDSIDFVLGGFHLLHHFKNDINVIIKEFQALDVKRAGPAHCTGGSAQNLFKESYQENCLDLRAGSRIAV
ncbi:MAG: MBL fold metallo-hydrolase [Candidatus Omnitrophica bacterium]|nr:MBL fold metallo-hydrolase [Candidatus Omnitrophota bacterium]